MQCLLSDRARYKKGRLIKKIALTVVSIAIWIVTATYWFQSKQEFCHRLWTENGMVCP